MNRGNSTLSCENDTLINGLLKTELGFPEFVLPDINFQSTPFGSATAGLDFGSSTYWTASVLEAAIENGSFSEVRLDDMTVSNTTSMQTT
jgi:beta-glucosidase